jgi:hypothetical protein
MKEDNRGEADGNGGLPQSLLRSLSPRRRQSERYKLGSAEGYLVTSPQKPDYLADTFAVALVLIFGEQFSKVNSGASCSRF